MGLSRRLGLLAAGVGLSLIGGVAQAAETVGMTLQGLLNAGDLAGVSALMPEGDAALWQQRAEPFQAEFPQARWSVKLAEPDARGLRGLEVDVRGEAERDGLRYRLEASQSLLVRVEGGRLVEQELLNEQSLLRSGDTALPITVAIPDQVLTGSRYDVDVIVDEPLGHAVVAGGLLPLTPEQVRDQLRPNLPMAPLGGGGLFKSVQAPQRPGAQTWAVMLVHPDGLVTATKRVRVVSVIPRGTI